MLAAGSVQMCSYVVSSELPPLSAKLGPPLPPTVVNPATGKQEFACVSMAAGKKAQLTVVVSDVSIVKFEFEKNSDFNF